jgi:hypothetical protein
MRHPLYDAVMNANLNKTRHVAATVLDGLQNFAAPEQMTGLAAMFLLLCERFDFEPRVALQAAENMLRHAKFADADHFQGVRDYLAAELKDR